MRARLSLPLSAALAAACALPTGGMYVAGVDPACRDEAAGEAQSELVWVRAGAPRDRALQASWCETVGEPVVSAEPDERFALPAAPDSVLVVSWNMNLGGGDLASLLLHELGVSCGAPAARRGERPPGAFVLLLQEAYRRSELLPYASPGPFVPRPLAPPFVGEAEDVVELAARCGLALVYVPSHRNGSDTGPRPREDKGNAILSNLSLAAPAAVDLPFEAYRRVAAVADVRLEGRAPLRVVSAHLDVSGLPFRMIVSGGQARARQARGLVEALQLLAERRPGTSGTVVGADMNTWSAEEAAVEILRSALPRSPSPDRLSTRGMFPADHVFLGSGTGGPSARAYRVLERSYGSDHRGRALLLAWE